MKILIVDDHPGDIQKPYIIYQNMGFDVRLAFDGKSALEESLRHHFDYVILDWNMPHSGGRDFLIRYEMQAKRRKLSRYGKLNVIIYTGQNFIDFDEEILKAQSFLVIDIWRKPLSAVEILRRFKDVFHEAA